MIEFKRISPVPPPTPEQQDEMARLMLEFLMATPQDQWDDYLEPEEDIPADKSEFVNNVCPECGSIRVPQLDFMIVEQRKVGHTMSCSRWKKHWRYKDVWEGQLI